MVFLSSCWGCSRRQPKREDIFTETKENGIPRYKCVIRSQCPLLQACWEQDWDAAIRRLNEAPWGAFYKSQNSGRTPLHLSTMPGVASPSIELLRKLIEINPHAVLVSDDSSTNGSTPVHFICGNIATRDNPSLVRFFVETALNEQEKGMDSVGVHSGSPLYLAAKRGAPAETLDILVRTKRSVSWIAPWTGTETMEESQSVQCIGADSPLVALWSTCQHIPEFSCVDDDLAREMRELVYSNLDCDLDKYIKRSMDSSNRASVLEAWERIITLFTSPCIAATPSMMLHRVSNLYSPVPELVTLVCRLFPEQILQEAPEIPLHTVLRHTWSGKAADSIHDIIRTLMIAQPESLLRIHASTRLYTVFLAASHNTSHVILFDMMRLAPHALQLQRTADSDRTLGHAHDTLF